MKTGFEAGVPFEKARIFPMRYRNLRNMPHWHREHELLYVESGMMTVMTDGHSFMLKAGEAAFLHSEMIHSFRSEDGAVAIVAKLDADYFTKIIGLKRLSSPCLIHDYGWSDTFAELFDELREGKEYGGIIADSIARRLIAQIFRSEPTEQGTPEHRETTERYKALLERITKEYVYITFDDAAAFMHFSRPYFSKYFYTHAGLTFTHYLNMIRVNAAVELLLDGKLSVTEISQRCGFNTIRNFNRVFKSLTGFPPNQLPSDYDFIHALRDYSDSGFDPTLACTEVLE